MSVNMIIAVILAGMFGWFGTRYTMSLGWSPLQTLLVDAVVGGFLGVIAAALDIRSGK